MRILKKFVVASLTAAAVFGVSAAEKSESMSPDAALKLLVEGNMRFVLGTPLYEHQNQEWRSLTAAHGQFPYVSILSCADSRVPVEFIFDAGIGDLFVIRVAGNVADVDEIGTIEYGVGHLHTPLLLVLGHTKCGAVTAVVNKSTVHGSIPQLVDNIVPAAQKAEAENPQLRGDSLVQKAIAENVRRSLEDILVNSEEVRSLIKAKKLMAVGAMYNLETGQVKIMGKHPQEAALIAGSGKKSRGGHGAAPAGH